MEKCVICGFVGQSLVLHLRKKVACFAKLAERLASDIPKEVAVLPQCSVVENSNDKVLTQQRSRVEKRSAVDGNGNESSSNKRRSNRRTFVVHKPNGFGQGKVMTDNVFGNDISTIGMNGINPVDTDYWSRVDEYMDSGDLNMLCPESLDNENGNDVLADGFNGEVTDSDVNTELNEENTVLPDYGIKFIPVNECLMTTSFTPEERVLTRVAEVCSNANAPLYLVDEVMDIIRDECDNGLSLDQLFIRKRDSFMKHLLTRFAMPKAHVLHIGIEALHASNMEYKREFRDSVSVVYYNFLEQVHDLLNDITIWGDVSNFEGTVDMANPFGNDCSRNDGLVDEIHDAHWYCETNKQCKGIAGNEPYLVLPVVAYIDKTGTDVNQRNKLEPFSFTFSILNRRCRYRSNSWRVLGFMPDLEHKSSAAIARGRSGLVGKGRMARNYHRCLAVILQSFISNQGKDFPIYATVRIGNHVARRRVFFPLAFVIGDGLSGDQLCGRYKNYSPNVSRLSRACDVSFQDSDNPDWKCRFLKMSDLQKISMTALELSEILPNEHVEIMPVHQRQAKLNQCMEQLQKMSQHMHDNAFDNVWFGVNAEGILGACPTDLMHAFLHGLIPYIVRIIIGSFSTNDKHKLDLLVDEILVPNCSGERSKYPRTNFARGISNLKLLTANEWAGVAFAIALIINSDQGFNIFNNVYKRKQQKKERMQAKSTNDKDQIVADEDSNVSKDENDGAEDGNSRNGEELNGVEKSDHAFHPNNVMYLLEMLLSFHAWYKSGGPYNCGTEAGRKEIHGSIVTLLKSIQEEVPRSIRNGWKLQKFHDMLHVSRDMFQFGSPENWDASPGEHNLIDFAKRPARRTQKRNDTFTMQVTQRLQESAVLSKVSNILSMKKIDNSAEQITETKVMTGIVGRSFASLLYENGSLTCVYRNVYSKHNYVHPVVLKLFNNEFNDNNSMFYECPLFQLFYEYKREGILYRAHPNYQSMGAWFEWTMVKFGLEDDEISDTDSVGSNQQQPKYFADDEYPSKIYCFFTAGNDPDIYAIVHSCERRHRRYDSVIFQRWRKEVKRISPTQYEPLLRAVPVDSFGERVLVIEDDSVLRETMLLQEIKRGCTLVLPRQEFWPNQFLSL